MAAVTMMAVYGSGDDDGGIWQRRRDGDTSGIWIVDNVGERSNFKKIPTHTQDHGDA